MKNLNLEYLQMVHGGSTTCDQPVLEKLPVNTPNICTNIENNLSNQWVYISSLPLSQDEKWNVFAMLEEYSWSIGHSNGCIPTPVQ